ncbi:hypothetical protein MC885_013727 [Smutsia gigantea]|nr:hypothetical protein MC885_013727 [Smutsia gigantea]
MVTGTGFQSPAVCQARTGTYSPTKFQATWVVRSRLHRTSQQNRAKEPGAFGFQRREKLEALEGAPSASAQTPYPYRWEPRE